MCIDFICKIYAENLIKQSRSHKCLSYATTLIKTSKISKRLIKKLGELHVYLSVFWKYSVHLLQLEIENFKVDKVN